MKKILVTGAYGYIGSHTVKALAQYGFEVTALDNKKTVNDISKYASKIIINDISEIIILFAYFEISLTVFLLSNAVTL